MLDKESSIEDYIERLLIRSRVIHIKHGAVQVNGNDNIDWDFFYMERWTKEEASFVYKIMEEGGRHLKN